MQTGTAGELSAVRTREIDARRIFVEYNPGYISGLAHFGKQWFSKADRSLQEHIHRGIMEICYLDGGEQFFCVGKKKFCLRGGDVFIAFPDERHGSGGYPMEKSILYWMGIDLSNAGDSLFDCRGGEGEALRSLLLAMRRRHFKGDQALRESVEKMIAAFLGQSPLKRVIIRNAAADFALHIVDLERSSRGKRVSALLGGVLRHIEAAVGEDLTYLSVARLAGFAQLSVPRFKQRFRDEVGIAPREYVLRAKIEKAKDMLRATSTSVTRIALDLGFSSSQYFATVFNRFVNCSPRHFRRRFARRPHAAE